MSDPQFTNNARAAAKALEELDAEIKIARKKAEQRAAPLPKKVSLYGGVSPNDEICWRANRDL